MKKKQRDFLPIYFILNALVWDKDHGAISLHDNPQSPIMYCKLIFEASIVAVNYNGSKQNRILASFKYGWDEYGALRIHSISSFKLTPGISETSLEIIKKQYPNYPIWSK